VGAPAEIQIFTKDKERFHCLRVYRKRIQGKGHRKKQERGGTTGSEAVVEHYIGKGKLKKP
jgi:hypothetical protein